MSAAAATPWAEIVTALAVFAANVLSPGPNVFNTIAIALGSGRRAALAVVPAVALGVLLWASAAILGAAVLFRRVPALEAGLTVLGGCLLIWFAIRYLRRAWFWSDTIGQNRVVTPREAFAITLGILATNPKALTTWLVLVTIFPAGSAGPGAIAAMVLGAAAVAALGHLAYALAFSTRRAAQAYARIGRWINAAVGVFFATLGVTLLLSVVRVEV
ncbi:MAG TPA: LysE family transporter [Thermohalobaculum sp.]|nr:LysE family transporter [Thermohalobaculum sp.]